MCQMIVSRHGAPVLSLETANKLLSLNPHGGGIAVAVGGRLSITKARYLTVDLLLSWLAAVPAEARVLVHLRQATCGPTDEAHVQPFPITSTTSRVFAHNGTLPGWGSEFLSDSADIAQNLLASDRCSDIQHCQDRLTAIWQPGNRFVLLDADSRFVLIGEHEGVWRDHVWWSNPKQIS